MSRTLTVTAYRQELGHLTDTRHEQRIQGAATVRTYRTFPLTVRRPDGGTAVREMSCGLCGESLRLRVHSIARARQARLNWFVLGVVGLVLLVVFAGDVLVFDGWIFGDRLLRTASLMLLSIVAAVLGLTAVVVGLLAWWLEDGVRMLREEQPGSHRLLFPGKRR